MKDTSRSIIRAKQFTIEELKVKKKKITICGAITGAVAILLFILGVNGATKTNTYEKETVLIEYKDFDPNAVDTMDRVKVKIKNYTPLYSMEKTGESVGLAGNVCEQCWLAVTEDNQPIFLLIYDPESPISGIRTVKDELKENGITEIKGRYTTVTASFLQEFEVDEFAAQSVAEGLYSLGFADESDVDNVKNDPHNISKVISKALKETGAISVSLWEKEVEVTTVTEETKESIIGKIMLAAALGIFVVAVVFYILGDKQKRRITEIKSEILKIEMDEI